MVALTGLEKFSHLEDKKLANLRGLGGDKQNLATHVERLLAERELIRLKVEAMLDAVIALDPEAAEAVSK